MLCQVRLQLHDKHEHGGECSCDRNVLNNADLQIQLMSQKIGLEPSLAPRVRTYPYLRKVRLAFVLAIHPSGLGYIRGNCRQESDNGVLKYHNPAFL